MMPEWTRGQWGLRVTMALGPVLALWSTTLAGVAPRVWLVLLVLGLSLAYSWLPESPTGLVAMAAVLIWWGVALRDGLQPAALLATACLLAAHVAGLLAASGPGDLPVDPATARRWLLRGGGAFLLALGLFAFGVLLRGQPEPSGVWVAGLAAALVVVAAAGLAVRSYGRN